MGRSARIAAQFLKKVVLVERGSFSECRRAVAEFGNVFLLHGYFSISSCWEFSGDFALRIYAEQVTEIVGRIVRRPPGTGEHDTIKW